MYKYYMLRITFGGHYRGISPNRVIQEPDTLVMTMFFFKFLYCGLLYGLLSRIIQQVRSVLKSHVVNPILFHALSPLIVRVRPQFYYIYT